MTHRKSYTKLYWNKTNYDAILDASVHCITSSAPFDKWMRFLEMGHLIVSTYDEVCIYLTRYGFSETFSPLLSKPPQNSFERIMRFD